MKTIFYNILIVFLLLPMAGLANGDFNGRYTKQKKITKNYSVSSTALLRIDNSYGNIDITTWNQNRIEIEVIVKANGNDEEKVLERLEEIDVEFRHSSSEVSAKTLLEKKSSSWWNIFTGGSSNINIEINYRIKAPVRNSVDLSNNYGNINLDRLEGNAKIECDYGRLYIGELLGDHNQLSFDYTRNSQIAYIKRGKISADYSEYSIDEAGTLEISTDYTDTHIRKVENISFNGDYGNIQLDKVRNVKGQGDYLGTKIGSVYGSLDLNLDYGSASVGRIMKSLSSFAIKSDYTSIKIGYDSNNPFSFHINTSYGNVRGIDDKDFYVGKRHQSNTANLYEGYYLDANAGGNIRIDSSYGNITFQKL